MHLHLAVAHQNALNLQRLFLHQASRTGSVRVCQWSVLARLSMRISRLDMAQTFKSTALRSLKMMLVETKNPFKTRGYRISILADWDLRPGRASATAARANQI